MMAQPLTHARIGYDSITERGTIVASSELIGLPASAAANPLTYSWWGTGLPATYEVQLDEAETCDFFGVAAHNLRSKNAQVVMQALINQEWRTMPVLTLLGDIWDFSAGKLVSNGGASPGVTTASVVAGVAADGDPVYDLETGEPESHAGALYSVAVDAATENLFPANVRTAGDSAEDTDGFTADGGSTVGLSNNRVHGDFGVELEGTMVLDPVTVEPDTYYSFQCKVKATVDETELEITVHDESENVLSTNTVFVDKGGWFIIKLEEILTLSGTSLEVSISAGETAYFDDFQLEQDEHCTTWVNGSRAEGGLVYPGLPYKDLTVACWARTNAFSEGTILSVWAGSQQILQFWCVNNTLRIQTWGPESEGPSDDSDLISPTVTLGGWQHVAAVVQASASPGEHNVFLYLNGVLAQSKEFSTEDLPDISASTALHIGHSSGSSLWSSGFRTARLSNLVVLNRAAPSEEISDWAAVDTIDEETIGLPVVNDDRPIMRLVEPATSTQFRLVFTGGEEAVQVGVIYMGKALEMARPIYGGHAPISLSRAPVVRPSETAGGQFVGRVVERTSSPGSWSWTNLPAAWVRLYLDAFLKAAIDRPFFILWRPETFPEEAGYCWTEDAPEPPRNQGVRDLMSWTLTARGLGHE